MTLYEVGSVANFVSQNTEKIDGKKKLQKNQAVLDQLFAASNVVNTVVANVPVPAEKPKKIKKKKRQADEYAISSIPKMNKTKDVNELDEDEVDNILNPGPAVDDDDFDDNQEESEKASRKMKKNELKNIKKRIEKGKLNEDSDRVVLVKNLPADIKRKTVHHFFAKFGKIDATWLRCAALADPAMPKKVAVIKQQFHPDRQSISAFVRFHSAESAKEAVSATGCEFQERHISISLLADSTSKKQLGLGIFVGNLPFNVDDEALWLHFGECGKIADVRVVRDRANGLGKGFGYVNFESPDSVELALKLDQSLLNDRAIRVSRCKRNPKPTKTEDNANSKDGSKETGAYKRLQQKHSQQERKKGAGWITKMKQRNKESGPKTSLNKVGSFAGETTGDGAKVVRMAKTVKRNKEENRKKVIAAKLSYTNKKQ